MAGYFGKNQNEEENNWWDDILGGSNQTVQPMGSYRGKPVEGYDPGVLERQRALAAQAQGTAEGIDARAEDLLGLAQSNAGASNGRAGDLYSQIQQAMAESNARAPENQAEVARLAALPLKYSSIGSVKNGNQWDGFTKPIIDAANDKYDTYNKNDATRLQGLSNQYATNDKNDAAIYSATSARNKTKDSTDEFLYGEAKGMANKVDDYVKNSRDYAIAEEQKDYTRSRDAIEDKQKQDAIDRAERREDRADSRLDRQIEREDRRWAKEDERENRGTSEDFGISNGRLIMKTVKNGETKYVYADDGTTAKASDLGEIKKIGEKGTSSANTEYKDGYIIDKTNATAKKVEGLPDDFGKKDDKLTEGQSKDNVYYTRAVGAAPIVDAKGESLTGAGGYWGNTAGQIPVIGNALKTEGYQEAEQASRELIMALLRKDSGATLTESEDKFARETWIPETGDGPGALKQKADARKRAIEALRNGMNPMQVEMLQSKGVNTDYGSSKSNSPSSSVNIPDRAREALKANPKLADQFDQKYGPGAARQVLGGY